MKLSIVSSIYYGEKVLPEFHRRIIETIRSITDDYEIILVNDDSPDDALQVALDLQKSDPRIKIIDLARNYGHTKALMAGLSYAQGDLVFQTGCSLEEKPEALADFFRAYQGKEDEIDVVWGRRDAQFDNAFRRMARRFYFRILTLFANMELQEHATISRLMTRRYVDCLVQHHEREMFLPGIWVLAGFEQIPVDVIKESKGTKPYRIMRKLIVLIDSIVSFSHKPLVWIFYLGCAIISFSVLAALYIVILKLGFSRFVPGSASLMIVIWALGGLSLFTLGVIGIYLSKVYTEAKHRPYSLVREIYSQKADSNKQETNNL